jgi:nucleoside-diphosphate-sugar epimerase
LLTGRSKIGIHAELSSVSTVRRTSRAHTVLGYQPRIDVREGLRRCAAFYASALRLNQHL